MYVPCSSVRVMCPLLVTNTWTHCPDLLQERGVLSRSSPAVISSRVSLAVENHFAWNHSPAVISTEQGSDIKGSSFLASWKTSLLGSLFHGPLSGWSVLRFNFFLCPVLLLPHIMSITNEHLVPRIHSVSISWDPTYDIHLQRTEHSRKQSFAVIETTVWICSFHLLCVWS